MVRQIVRRDREGFEPLVPRESSARGTEGSNPSSSSGESTANRTFANKSAAQLRNPMPEGIFIIEFQTADAARRWYQSDDYQEALKVRLSSSRGRVFLIEGNEISSAVPVAGLDAGKN